ncbi:transcription repressor OFP2-like [Olea europaea var. sylvestris]|uniref:Transcription repressor n=1 Tax=Olea europaea subsp. europaea TaxID=158383 RepID=A0A8S0PWC4_OLEEU|nr:transcription repressor OFP2-like [Olea europaea var. sylvestris]CAA2959439.1 transcription repressor OFP4-like [Olea europaea subsp. europaea]
MGNYRFRLSDMMPNAWFYKLKDMSKTRNHNTINKKHPSPTKTAQKPHFSQPRKSYYYTTESIRVEKLYTSPKNPRPFDPPRKSSTKRTKRKTVYKPSPRQISPSVCNHEESMNSVRHKVEQFQDYFECSTVSSTDKDFLKSPTSEFGSDTLDAPPSVNGLASWSSSCGCTFNSSGNDIVMDMDEKMSALDIEETDELFNIISEPKLPPILTKPTKFNTITMQPFPEQDPSQIRNSPSLSDEIEARCLQKQTPTTRKSTSRSPRVKIRGASPRLASKKIQGNRKSVLISRRSKAQQKKNELYTESVAIVKASFDPEKDFRESMMEMIVENNIRASKDLENLLACYLSLNPDEYHDLIIKAFEQIWFNIAEVQS